jgi:two-component system sensor histidine kinase MtrB
VELHRQLEGMLREKDRFIATVSHELRTPLTGVLGFASELRDGLPGFTSVEIIEFAGLIARGCATANNLVEDLLVAAKLDTGDLDLRPEPTDLYAEALTLIAEPESSSRTEGKSLTVEGEPSIAWADPHRVHQIMRNLVGNATRYGGNHIGIVVGREPESSTAFLRVGDDGPGVPDELADLLFQPYQHSPRNVDPHESMGLGLYISRKLARLMKGELSYRREDDTTIFELVLPLYHEGTTPAN